MRMTNVARAQSVFAASCLALLGGCRVASSVQTPAAGGVPRAFGPPAALPTPAKMQRGEAKPAVWVPSAMGPRVAADADVASLAGGTGIELEHAGENAPRTTGRLDLFVDPSFMAWQDPQQPENPQEPRDERWSNFLPLGREAVLAAGYELPRAFGVGVAYTRLHRDIEVDEVRTGLDGAPLDPVNFLAVRSDSTVDNVMGRLDAWIFPFWNVSVLGGWTWNDSASEVTVTVPGPGGPQDVTFAVPTKQQGPTFGVGTNLAAGYGDWFISGDGQWIRVDMEDFATIEAFLGTIRSGWNGKIDKLPVRLWGGVTYWDTATTIAGSVPTSAGELRFEVDQGPVTPYSLLVGANVDFDRGHGAMCELHLLEDVRMLVLAVALRF
jgi:hypothetical protein